MIKINETKSDNDKLSKEIFVSKRSTQRLKSNITVNSITVSVLPRRTSWSDIQGFKAMKYGPFVFRFRNINNEIVAGITFYISYNSFGEFDEKSNYLSEVTVLPVEVFAKPGYDFVCDVTAGKPMNYGTKDNPIAGVVLKVQLQVNSFHKLKSDSSYLLHKQEEVTISTLSEHSESMKMEGTLDSDQTKYGLNSKVMFSAKHYPEKRRKPTANVLRRFISYINSEEQYLNVIVRGDGHAMTICGKGY